MCDEILPFITNMAIHDKREHVLTNYKAVENMGRVTAVFLSLKN